MPIADNLELFAKWVAQASRIVFLTGAGISTESGIPDFRSADGLYADPGNRNIFEIDSFAENPEPFFRFAARFFELMTAAAPNRAHLAIARLQDRRTVSVVTQNVDNLHQRAGSREVHPVHGTFEHSVCLGCGARTRTEALLHDIRAGKVPRHACGGLFKPEITFFGEPLPTVPWEGARRAIAEADILCVVGSSLVVYPAAALPSCRPAACRLVIVNRDPTPWDGE
nr:Sir2 family NAD-dependent protein deacetylase [bacterium]